MVQGLGCRVLVLRAEDSRFRVYDLGFGVEGGLGLIRWLCWVM